MKVSRLSRLVEIIGLLQAGRGFNASSLALECGVSRRTVFRDIDVLRQAGIPLQFDEQRQRYFITGRQVLPATNFTADEALTLMSLCYQLGDRQGIPFFGPAQSAAVKLESTLPARLRDHLRDVGRALEIRLDATSRLDDSQEVYQQLLMATSARVSVRIRYDSFTDGEPITTKLKPYQLLFSRRSWYCIGRSSIHRATRTFNVARIQHLAVLDDTFEVPRGFSISRYLGNAWHLIPEPGPDNDVHVRFQPLVARNVAEVAWHRTQRTELNPDGTLDFHATVSGLGEISWWILGYGDQAEVIQPPELRRMIADRCAKALARYQSPASIS